MDKEAILNREKHGRRNDLRRAYNQKKVTSMLFGGGKLTDVDRALAMGYSSIEEANAFVRKYAAWEKQRKACKKRKKAKRPPRCEVDGKCRWVKGKGCLPVNIDDLVRQAKKADDAFYAVTDSPLVVQAKKNPAAAKSLVRSFLDFFSIRKSLGSIATFFQRLYQKYRRLTQVVAFLAVYGLAYYLGWTSLITVPASFAGTALEYIRGAGDYLWTLVFGVGETLAKDAERAEKTTWTTLYGIMGATAGFGVAKAGIAAATTALGPVGAAGGFLLMYGVAPAAGMLSGMTWGSSVGALKGQAASETVKAHWAMFLRDGLNHDVLPWLTGMIGVVPEKRLSKSSKLKIMGALSFLTVALTLKYRYHTTTASVYDAIGTNLAKTGISVLAPYAPLAMTTFMESQAEANMAKPGSVTVVKPQRIEDSSICGGKRKTVPPRCEDTKGCVWVKGSKGRKGRCEPHRKRIK